LAEKETVLENYKNIAIISAADRAQVEEKWTTIIGFQNDIATKLQALYDRPLIEQYLKWKQNEALIKCWEELILDL
jgi:hypothetical protein